MVTTYNQEAFRDLNITSECWNNFCTAAKFTFNFSFEIKIFKSIAFGHLGEMPINIFEQNPSGTKEFWLIA